MNNLIENNDNTAMILEAELPISSIYSNVIIIRDEAVFNIVYHNKTDGIITVECGDQLWLLQDVEGCVATTFNWEDKYAGYWELADTLRLEENASEYDRPDLDDHEYLIHTGVTLADVLESV